MHKKRNILLLSSWFPSEKNHEYGSFVYEQARVLQERGHRVCIIKPSVDGSFYNGIGWNKRSKFYHYNEFTILEVKIKPFLPGFRPWTLRKLAKVAFEEASKMRLFDDVEIIHSHAMFDAGFVAKYFYAKTRIPWIHTEHSSQLVYKILELSLSEKTLVNGVLRTAGKVVFVSEFFRTQVQQGFGLENHPSHLVISNFLSDDFTQNPLALPKKYTAISIQSMEKVKQPKLLVDAWSSFCQNHTDALLLYIGKGSLKTEVWQHAKKMGLLARIVFQESATRIEIKERLNESGFYISSSASETFGLAILEALSQGLPVVCIQNGGSDAFINESNGLLTQNTLLDLSLGIEKMHGQKGSYQKDGISKAICDTFNADKVLCQIEAQYELLIP